MAIGHNTRRRAQVHGVQAFFHAGDSIFDCVDLASYDGVGALELGGPVHSRLEAFLEEGLEALHALLEEVDAPVRVVQPLRDLPFLRVLLGG